MVCATRMLAVEPGGEPECRQYWRAKARASWPCLAVRRTGTFQSLVRVPRRAAAAPAYLAMPRLASDRTVQLRFGLQPSPSRRLGVPHDVRLRLDYSEVSERRASAATGSSKPARGRSSLLVRAHCDGVRSGAIKAGDPLLTPSPSSITSMVCRTAATADAPRLDSTAYCAGGAQAGLPRWRLGLPEKNYILLLPVATMRSCGGAAALLLDFRSS